MTDVTADASPTEGGDGGDGDGGRTLGRSSLINLVGFAVYGVANFALIVVITRQLGEEGAGAFLTAIAVFNIVARSCMAGTDLGLVRFTSRFVARGRGHEVRHLFRIALGPVLVVASLAGLALFLLADPLGQLLTSGGEGAGAPADQLASYLRVLGPFVPVAAAYQVLEGGSRGFDTMVPSVAVERLGRSTSLPVIMLLVLAGGGGATAVGLAWAGPFAVALVPIALWTTRLVRRAEKAVVARFDRPEPMGHAQLRRRFWAFALPRSFAGVFALTILWVDALLLGILESTEAVGVYTAATRWLIVGNFAGNAVALAFGPQISSVLAREGADGARRLFQAATAWLILLAWPAYFTAMIFAPYLVTAFGDGFGAGASVIAIPGVGFLLSSAAGPIDMLLLMAGRSRLSLINTGLALATNIGANLILIPLLGIQGAALAWTLSLAVANGLPAAQMWVVLRIQPFGPRSLRALAIVSAVGLSLGAARLLLGATLAGLVVGVVLGGLVLVAGVRQAPDRMGVADVLRRAAP
ncbi:N/A [soil metagenome]